MGRKIDAGVGILRRTYELFFGDQEFLQGGVTELDGETWGGMELYVLGFGPKRKVVWRNSNGRRNSGADFETVGAEVSYLD